MDSHLVQGSNEWLSWRRKYICASDSIALMGQAPLNWKKNSPYHIWISKQNDYVEEEPNFYMKRGKELEPIALRLFEQATGYLMSPSTIVSSNHGFMAASLDGIEIDGRAAVEIKAPGNKDHWMALDGKVPEKYIPQLQHQLSVTGLDKIYYCSYHPDHVESLKIIEVFRDQDYIDKLIKKESHFYHNHMLTGIPPDPEIIQPKLIESEAWTNLSNEYLRLDRIEKDSAKRKEEIKDLLIQLSGEENAKGNGITLQKIERKGIINYSLIPDLKQMDLERFRKPNTYSWRIDGMD